VDVDRSLGLAAAELVAFVGVTAVATYLLESKLVREMGAYLRGRVPEARPA
jgi:hypothetical protein